MKMQPVIGIITRRNGSKFSESRYFRDLYREGQKLGASVYFFSDEDLQITKKRIHGFTPTTDGWKQAIQPWPDIVIDRRRSNWTPRFRRLRKKHLFPYANRKFVLKETATRMFSESEEVQQWIPKTAAYSLDELGQMMERFPLVYVKPGNGTGGSSVVRIARKDGHWMIWGRERGSTLRKARLDTIEQVNDWINRWVSSERIRNGTFIVQQGLNLELVPGRVVDNRMFIQKNGSGEWEFTGIATRIGGPNSPTTNLIHGDGKAQSFDAFMKERFGEDGAASIRSECEKMAFALVKVIEDRFGPMMEFGLDVGIDVEGKVWLIEANPKPNRDVFLKTGEQSIYRKTLQRPLQYALYLLGSEQVD